MQQKQIKIEFIRHMNRFICTCIAITLFFILLLQSIILILEFYGYEFPIPEFLIQMVDKQLKTQNLSIKTGKKWFNSNGDISMNNVVIYHGEQRNPLLECEHLAINLSFLSSLFGTVSFDELSIKNATLYTPPEHSPTGLNEKVITNLSCSLYKEGRMLEIDQISFVINNISILADGHWRFDGYRNEKIDFMEYLIKLGVKLINWREICEKFQNPAINLTFDSNVTQESKVNFRIQFEKLTDLYGLNLGPTETWGELSYNDDKFIWGKDIEASFKNIQWKNKLQAEQGSIKVRGPLVGDAQKLPLFREVEILVKNIHGFEETLGKDVNFSTAGASIDFKYFPKAKGKIFLVNGSEWLELTGSATIGTKDWHTTTRGAMDVNSIRQFLPEVIKNDPDFPHLMGKISWDGRYGRNNTHEYITDNADLLLTSTDLQIEGTLFSNVYANVKYQPGKLSITDVYLKSEKDFIQGHYFQDLNADTYRYLVEGVASPYLLNRWLTEWWDDLWSKIELKGRNPWTNIDINGKFNTKEKATIFADISSEKLSYRKIPFTFCGMRLYATDEFLEMSDLLTKSGQGNANVYLRFEYGTDEARTIQKTSIDGYSTLPLEQIDIIVDDKYLHDIIKTFNCFKAPTVRVKGYITKDGYQNDVITHFDTDHSLLFRDFPLDYLSFDARYFGPRTELRNIQAGFAKGQVTATVDLGKLANGMQSFKYEAKLLDAPTDLVTERLKSLYSKNQSSNEDTKYYGGFIDAESKGSGIVGDMKSITGTGHISISDANFGQVNLFGILSRVLSLTPFGIGSFQLTDAQSNFQLNHGTVFFPDLKIFGSSMMIESQGSFEIESKNIDFLLSIGSNRESGVPILSHALLLFQPLTESIQVRLRGTLDNPKWDTSLTPLGFLKKKK